MTKCLVGERGEREIKYLTQDQVRALFRAAKGRCVRDRLMLAMAYKLAMRTQELCDLPADAIDRERWEITVQGAKHGLRRTYSVPADLKPLIRAYDRVRDSSQVAYFTGRRGQLDRRRVWQIYREVADSAGIEPGFGLHSLRHASATHALDAGCDVEDLRDLLRHRHATSTSVYETLSVTRRHGYLDKLEKSRHVVKVP